MVVVIRILFVNEVDLFCNALSTVLEDESDIKVIGFADTANQALILAPQADIILVNTKPSGGLALELIRALERAEVSAKIIALGTVKNHVHNILQKLAATSRHEAAITWAIEKRRSAVAATQ